MYPTLEKQYIFFKILQESNYPEKEFTILDIKEAWNVIENGAFDKINKTKDLKTVCLKFNDIVNKQIKLYNKNAIQVKKTNTILNTNTINKENSANELARLHKEKFNIKEENLDLFEYNKSNLGGISYCLGNSIGALYSCELGGLEKIMDLKDCNIQIAKFVYAKNKANR